MSKDEPETPLSAALAFNMGIGSSPGISYLIWVGKPVEEGQSSGPWAHVGDPEEAYVSQLQTGSGLAIVTL